MAFAHHHPNGASGMLDGWDGGQHAQNVGHFWAERGEFDETGKIADLATDLLKSLCL
jgi:hypothetical protein